jgi:hypothetical protein
MTNDFGSRLPRKRPPYRWIAAAALVLLGLIAISFVPAWIKHRNEAMAEAARFAIDGPPCPAASEAQFAAGQHVTPQGLTFGEVRFERQYGHASCSTLRYDGGKALETYPVCQFVSPAALTVVTPKGRFHFLPGLGQSATVFVEHDQPRCVMAINKALF